MLCCITSNPKIISICLCHSPKQIVQTYFHHHLFYHVLKLSCRYMFSIGSFYRRKHSFSHPSLSILSLLLPFEEVSCLVSNFSVSYPVVFAGDDGVLSYPDSRLNL